MVQLDITGKNFDYIDFSEALAFINLMPELGPSVELNFWGITLRTYQLRGQAFLQDSDLDLNDDTYIVGLSKIIFHEVMGGELKVTLYDPNSPNSFLKDKNNQPITLKKCWEFDPEDSSVLVYQLECISDWPPGTCYLALASKGTALLTFDISDCIPSKELISLKSKN